LCLPALQLVHPSGHTEFYTKSSSNYSPTASPARSASPASSPKAPPRPAHTLSVKEYRSEHQRLYKQDGMDPTTDKTSSDAARRPRLARDDLFADLEEQVDYGSNTSIAPPQRSPGRRLESFECPTRSQNLGLLVSSQRYALLLVWRMV
jgi:hypothetical protein